jgi:hypothetical protein
MRKVRVCIMVVDPQLNWQMQAELRRTLREAVLRRNV